MESFTGAEMPKYKCYKEVHALKIAKITVNPNISARESDGSAVITPEDSRYSPFEISGDYMRKHSPEVGGYFVVYVDGYESYSPAKAFEDGYTLINN
jgi:hypothetical protein